MAIICCSTSWTQRLGGTRRDLHATEHRRAVVTGHGPDIAASCVVCAFGWDVKSW